MPAELFMMIFEELGWAPDQICLALSCKYFGQLAAQVKLAQIELSFDYPWGYRLDLAKQLKKWMPKTLKMCQQCHKFYPRDEAYWLLKHPVATGEDSDGEVDENVKKWCTKTRGNRSSSRLCPECQRLRERKISARLTWSDMYRGSYSSMYSGLEQCGVGVGKPLGEDALSHWGKR